jgi:integrase
MPFHVLRHFHASWLIGPADYKLHEVQRQLRHSRASITSDTYAHLFGDGIDIARMDAAAEKRRNKRDAR